MVVDINNLKYFIDYHGERMTLREFANRLGVRYDTLRARAVRGKDLFSPITTSYDDVARPRSVSTKDGGYTLEELAELYVKFRNDEDALEILADLACLRRRSSAAVRLQRRIEEYLEQKRKEIQGE